MSYYITLYFVFLKTFLIIDQKMIMQIIYKEL